MLYAYSIAEPHITCMRHRRSVYVGYQCLSDIFTVWFIYRKCYLFDIFMYHVFSCYSF